METPSPWSPEAVAESKLVFLGKNGGDDDEEYYSLDDLLRSSAEVLGKGNFGTSYKAYLEGKRCCVAVKRLKSAYCLSDKDFQEKLQELGTLLPAHHQNLLPLQAYCCHRNEIILVYEFMTRGSLASALHGNRGVKKIQLTWKVRCNIIHGVSRAIRYLHNQGPNVCHGNIRSSNVLLTNTYNACLSDFGITHLVTRETNPILVAGYRAPEIKYVYEVSQKSDVYSFGVLLLELLTCKPPSGIEIDLVKWVRLMFQEMPILDVFDSSLVKHIKDQNMEAEMIELLQLAVCCTFQNPSKRPSMVAITNQIQQTCKFVCWTQDTKTSLTHQFLYTVEVFLTQIQHFPSIYWFAF